MSTEDLASKSIRHVAPADLAEHAQAIEHGPLGLGSRMIYQTLRVAIHSLCRGYFRLEVVNPHHVPVTGAFLLAPIHRSNLDFALVSNVTDRHMRYMGKSSVWKVHWTFSSFFNALGGFPVERGSVDRDTLRISEQVLANGEPLVIFPEGARQAGPLVQPLFDGIAFISARSGAPIVPLGIGGSANAMPIGRRFIRPRKIVLVVGDPIPAPEKSAKGRVPRGAVREMTQLLSDRLQELYDEAERLAAQ